jgi:hypothetical protein
MLFTTVDISGKVVLRLQFALKQPYLIKELCSCFIDKYLIMLKTTNLNVCQELKTLLYSGIQVFTSIGFHKFQAKTTRIKKIHLEKTIIN